MQSVEDVVEPRLRAAGLLGQDDILIFQGSYNDSVSASGGTHSLGGAIDTAKENDEATIIWRESGWASWQRGSPQDSAFDDHQHSVAIGCPHLSPAAADQVYDYKQGRNGLADGGPDQSPPVEYIPWQDAYDKYTEADVRHVWLYLSTSSDTGTGSAVRFDSESSDEAGFHLPGEAAIIAPWPCVGTFYVEAVGGEVEFEKYNASNELVGDIGRSTAGNLAMVGALNKGERYRVKVVSGTVTSASLKADIRQR